MNFAQIIHPVTPADFFAHYYEKQPLYIAREDASYYHSFLSMQEIDAYLQLKQTYVPNVKMAFQGKEVSPLLFCDSETSISPLKADPAKMLHLFKQGYTIKYDKLHQTYPPLARKVSGIEQELGFKIRTSLYITPERSQGYGVHTDRHDVLALQLNGTKVWKVKASTEILPSVYETAVAVNWSEEGVQEIHLKAGDFFYCPRGLAHDVYTAEESSVHYTLGFKPTYGYDVVEKLSAIAYQNAFFRKAIPNKLSSALEREHYKSQLKMELQKIVNDLDVDVLLQEAARQKELSQLNFASNRFLSEFYQPTLQDEFVVSAKVIWTVSYTKVSCRIEMEGNAYDFPYLLKDFFAELKKAKKINKSFLPIALNDVQKVKLLKRLLKIKMIERSN